MGEGRGAIRTLKVSESAAEWAEGPSRMQTLAG